MDKMHLIINTHWDREYRWSFSETQFRLVEAVDDLITIMEEDPQFKYFHTDSQVSMLDDYLEVRPEMKHRLMALVKEQRIQTGPWYTLPAEYLVSGESLVRNLLLGHQIANELGNVMKAAYNIFSWGQVSQLPQIYKQFGMDTIIFYRGVDQSTLDTLEFKWIAPDGTEALGLTFGAYHRLNFWRYVYLPYIQGADGVKGDNHSITRENLGEDGFMFNLCDPLSQDNNHQVIGQGCARDLKAALEGLDRLRETVIGKSSTNELLFLQGFDQENPDPIITELVDAINQSIDYGEVVMTSLPDYMTLVKKQLEEKNLMDGLPTKTGEMLSVERVGDAFGPLYNGVFSARMPLKLMNAKAQYGLENYAEPTAVMSEVLVGKAYPDTQLDNAWKEILKNQQHDGIGGCHVDRVTQTMIERYDNALDIGNTVTRNSLKALVSAIDCSQLNDQEIALVLYNPTQFTRSEKVMAIVDIPKSWQYRYINQHSRRDFGLEVRDQYGNLVQSQVLILDDDTMFGYLKFGNVIEFDATRVYVIIEAKDIPSMGYVTYSVTPTKVISRPVETLVTGVNRMENDYLHVTINANGTLKVVDKSTGQSFDQLHYFEDAGDKGGPLKFDMPYEEGTITSLTSSPTVALMHKGPLYANYRISYQIALPEGLSTELKVHVPHGSEWVDLGRVKRSSVTKMVSITSDVILRKDSRQIEFTTTIDNTVCDHRLRVMFDTNLDQAKHHLADSPFDIVRRDIAVEDSTGWYENAALTWPTKAMVMVDDGATQVSLIHKGLSEYEVVDNPHRTIGMTLLRAISTAGNPTETHVYQTLAQCLGKHVFHYSLVIGQDMSPADVLKEAMLFNLPMKIAQTTHHQGVLPGEDSFIQVSEDGFIITALKKSADGQGYILRGYNSLEENLEITIKLNKAIRSVAKTTLEEISFDPIDLIGGDVSLLVGKKEIVTLYLSM